MDRRQFLHASAALAVNAGAAPAVSAESPGFASPREAMRGPKETLLFVTCTYADTGRDKPDYLAVVDVNRSSNRYGQVVHRFGMPNPLYGLESQ